MNSKDNVTNNIDDGDEMMDFISKNIILYNNFKNILDIKLDELLNCFNKNVNNLLKKILDNNNNLLKEDIRKQINNILNEYKTKLNPMNILILKILKKQNLKKICLKFLWRIYLNRKKMILW